MSLFHYNTQKKVTVRSVPLGLCHRLVQFVIICYIAVFVLWLRHGYQGQERAVGVSNIKLHGSSYEEYTDSDGKTAYKIFDALDTVFPQGEMNGLFITTNQLHTDTQQRGVCKGEDKKSESCDEDGKCAAGKLTRNGVTTGVCDQPSQMCMVQAWCPIEVDDAEGTELKGIDTFTIFMKNSVRFAKYGYTIDNVKSAKPIMGENLFHVTDLLKMAGVESFETIMKKGAFIAVTFKWDCDLDFAERREDCQPKVMAFRLDDPNSPSKGFNFRYYNKYRVSVNNALVEYRDQAKVWGVRMAFLTTGVGRKFEVVPFILNLASGMALLGVAALVADFIALRCLRGRKTVQETKFQQCTPNQGGDATDEEKQPLTRESNQSTV